MNHCQLLAYLKLHETSTHSLENHKLSYRQVPPCCQRVTDELIWFCPFQAKHIMIALPGLSQQSLCRLWPPAWGQGAEVSVTGLVLCIRSASLATLVILPGEIKCLF